MHTAQTPPCTQDVFAILELIQRIGSYLHPTDLLACVQVSQHWNSSLIPLLWEKIDDSTLSWPRIIEQHDDSKAAGDNEGKDWIRIAFVRYGCHIRHLRLHWRTTLDAACLGNHCIGLRSLHIGRIRHSQIQQPEHEWFADLNRDEQDEITDLRWVLAMDDSSIPPPLPVFSKRSEAFGRTLAQQELDWSTSRHFWTFLRHNKRLQRLYLDRSLKEFMEDVSPLYIVDTLASLKDLSALENTYLPIDRILGLESYTTSFALSESNTSTQTSPRLRHAGFKDINAYRDLLLLLRHAPNLESLHLGGIAGLGSVTPAEAAVIIGDTPSRLTVFRLDMRGHSYDFNMDRVFSWMPHLTTMTTHQLLPSMARSLSTFCTSLETVCEPHKAPIFGTREQATPPTTPALDLLLKHCPTLKKFDGIRHALSGQIWEEPWACQGLRYLRCRILGVQRLSCRDQQRYDAMVCAESRIQSEDEDDSRVAGLHRDSVEQQKIIYGRLATLTKLCVLDLGAEYRRLIGHRDVSDDNYILFNSPASDTLELTLESGLGLLGALKELKVFGFEGVDHRIEERELRWMATRWSRLKEMRGLHDPYPARIDYERRKIVLRECFEVLRPDVRHRGVAGRLFATSRT